MQNVQFDVIRLAHEITVTFNRSGRNGRRYADDIFELIILFGNCFVSMQISLTLSCAYSVSQMQFYPNSLYRV